MSGQYACLPETGWISRGEFDYIVGDMFSLRVSCKNLY